MVRSADQAISAAAASAAAAPYGAIHHGTAPDHRVSRPPMAGGTMQVILMADGTYQTVPPKEVTPWPVDSAGQVQLAPWK